MLGYPQTSSLMLIAVLGRWNSGKTTRQTQEWANRLRELFGIARWDRYFLIRISCLLITFSLFVVSWAPKAWKTRTSVFQKCKNRNQSIIVATTSKVWNFTVHLDFDMALLANNYKSAAEAPSLASRVSSRSVGKSGKWPVKWSFGESSPPCASRAIPVKSVINPLPWSVLIPTSSHHCSMKSPAIKGQVNILQMERTVKFTAKRIGFCKTKSAQPVWHPYSSSHFNFNFYFGS